MPNVIAIPLFVVLVAMLMYVVFDRNEDGP